MKKLLFLLIPLIVLSFLFVQEVEAATNYCPDEFCYDEMCPGCHTGEQCADSAPTCQYEDWHMMGKGEGATCVPDIYLCTAGCVERDSAQSYCESRASGCGTATWDSTASKCCGDDGGATDTWCTVGVGSCIAGTWSSDHCSDGIQNCDESGVDVGGADCPPGPPAPPAITSVIDSPDPINIGGSITFTVDWSDSDLGDQTKTHICKTNAISGQTCSGGSWCDTVSWDSTSPTQCSYSAGTSDLGTHNYYAFVCDDENTCSASTAGTFEVVEQAAGQITKIFGEIATVTVTCTDGDGDLVSCEVISPCAQSCSASGSSDSCACQFTCTDQATYDACGRATDSEGLETNQCETNALACVACLTDSDCDDDDPETTDECDENYTCCHTSTNQPPDKPGIPGIYEPDGMSWNHCSYQGKSIPTFHWTYSDPDDVPLGTDPQTAYEIRIDDNSGFPKDPDPNEFIELVTGGGTSYNPSHRLEEWVEWMDWNTNYWWIVRVKDSNGNWSELSDEYRFRTVEYAYPWPGFSWSPIDPNQDEVVIFDPEETNVYYLWTITEGEGVYTDDTGPTNEEPHIKFSTYTNRVQLEVTDPANPSYSCESSPTEGTLIEAQLPLPEYKEIPPISWLRKTLVAFIEIFDGFLEF